MAGHTKGPWEINKIGDMVSIMADPDSSNLDTFLGIAEVWSHDGERSAGRVEANARLIAAAPELLSALMGCLPQLELGNGEAEHIKAAWAAINKATGYDCA